MPNFNVPGLGVVAGGAVAAPALNVGTGPLSSNGAINLPVNGVIGFRNGANTGDLVAVALSNQLVTIGDVFTNTAVAKALTVATGLTVTAGGITVQSGTTALQALTLAGALTLPASAATPSLTGPLAANNVVVPTATATTLFTVGSYLNYNDALLVVGGDSVNAVFAVLVLRTGNANPVLQVLNATGCSFALSGGNLQVTQTTGASQTYTARALRVTGI